MSEIGTPRAASQLLTASTALSNTGSALSPATSTACHPSDAGPAASACPQASHTTAIRQTLRANGRGGIDRIIAMFDGVVSGRTTPGPMEVDGGEAMLQSRRNMALLRRLCPMLRAQPGGALE